MCLETIQGALASHGRHAQMAHLSIIPQSAAAGGSNDKLGRQTSA
jgi:hypothetical protein